MTRQLIRQPGSRFTRTIGLAALVLLAAGFAPATAEAATYVDAADFFADMAAIGAPVQTLDFDGQTAGTTIAEGDSLGGITFSNFSLGLDLLAIDDAYDTTSPSNYLGADEEPGLVLFQGGHGFSMGFAAANGMGLFIITAEVPDFTIYDDDVQLAASGQTASLDVSEIQDTLADESLVYFLGVIDSANTFTSAEFDSIPEFFFFNVDDVSTGTIPEPSTLVSLLCSCAVGLAASALRRRRARRTR